MLHFVRERGGEGVGVTLSSAQAEACRRHGLEVTCMMRGRVHRDTFGPFDAVASLGAFEHFCSPEDYGRAARRRSPDVPGAFANATVLPEGGRFYLQTMVFGPNMIDPDESRSTPRAIPTSGTWR